MEKEINLKNNKIFYNYIYIEISSLRSQLGGMGGWRFGGIKRIRLAQPGPA
jgi:hypothetical protein